MGEYKHVSVLLKEAIDGLKIRRNGTYVDCTFGGGGHSKEILKNLPSGHLYCFDQDIFAIRTGEDNLKQLGQDNYTIIEDNFAYIKDDLNRLGVTKVDGFLYDLGVSSFQFDMKERGFSYNLDAPLDMRMDQSATLNAKRIVNDYSYDDLKQILYEYGEEKFAPLIAKKICEARSKKEIETTFELVDIIKKALPAYALRKSGHPAKQTFQALRIEVNNELGVLKQSLRDALDMLATGGRIVVITFHSLEDRIVKNIFKEYVDKNKININVPIKAMEQKQEYALVNNKVIIPSDKELEENNRSHSAKMRIIEKL